MAAPRAFQAPLGKRIAVVTMGVKLGAEVRGYTRFRKISEMLVDAGFEVDLITSSFQHWDKTHRNTSDPSYQGMPYNIVFFEEPGYERNVDIKRIRSHRVAARNLAAHFASCPARYDLVYAEVPPNDVALAAAQAAENAGVPFVADINDLWPEAMRMALDVPLISAAAFHPFARDARKVYNMLTAAVGTSDEYAARPAQDRASEYPHITVYVGNDLAEFDAGVARYRSEAHKPTDQVWVSYAGTLGASYDVQTLVQAAAANRALAPNVRIKVLGDGPDRSQLEDLAANLNAPVDFLGYMEYARMAAWLDASDVVVNSLAKGAPQSIVTKIGDYLASGNPIINTGTSVEFCHKVTRDGFGVNVSPGNVDALAQTMRRLARNPSARKIMGARGRTVAEKEFDQNHSYLNIVHFVQTLLV